MDEQQEPANNLDFHVPGEPGTHTCPRRASTSGSTGPWELGEGLDYWKLGKCSFCGSLDPAKFMEGLREGKFSLIPTDKKYKVYATEEGHRRKFYWDHMTREQADEFIEMHNARKLKIDVPGYFYVLPYFAQRDPNQTR